MRLVVQPRAAERNGFLFEGGNTEIILLFCENIAAEIEEKRKSGREMGSLKVSAQRIGALTENRAYPQLFRKFGY